MQKTIAVITGASSGMGAEFVRTIESFGVRLDEIWAIARRQERLTPAASANLPPPGRRPWR